MKKNSIVWFLIGSLLLNGILGILFIIEKNSTKPYKQHFTMAILQAADNFKEYSANGNEEAYIYGAANVNTALRMVQSFEKSSTAYRHLNYVSELYGYMVVVPSKVKPYIREVVDAFALLGENSNDPNGYRKIEEVLNKLRLAAS